MTELSYTHDTVFGSLASEATGVRERVPPKPIYEHIDDALARMSKGERGSWWTVSRDAHDSWNASAVWPGGWACVLMKPSMTEALAALLGQLLEMEEP